LGCTGSKTGISADPQKVEAVQNFPIPTSLHSFLGVASYYHHFIPGFSTIVDPLFVLTQKNADFVLEEAQEAPFCQLKKLLVHAPLLTFPDFGQQFILETDASGKGLSTILGQMDLLNQLHMPVGHSNNMKRSMVHLN